MARVWLHQLGVAFEERDVYGAPGTAEELRALHVVRLPALRVGQQVVAGFDRARWLQAIAVAEDVSP